MKNNTIKIALILLAFSANHANAQSKLSPSNENVILSFEVGNPQASNAKLIIRNSAGQVVKSKTITTNYCNVDKSILGSGAYTYSIINGAKSAEGKFSIK